MENELLKFMQAVRDLHDEPCDKHRENLREVLSLEPAAAECPEVWRSSLGQEATPYLDIPMARALSLRAGAGPERYAFFRFCPSNDLWLEELAQNLYACRLFRNLSGRKMTAAEKDGPAVQGAERFMLDWLICVAGKGEPLQRSLCPAVQSLSGYLAAGTLRLLTRTRPVWFAQAVIPMREALRCALFHRLQEDLQEKQRREERKKQRKEDEEEKRSEKEKADETLPLMRGLSPGRKEVVRAWLKEHKIGPEPEKMEEAAHRLTDLLLPYASAAWKEQDVMDLPRELTEKACRLYGRQAVGRQPDQLLQEVLGGSVAQRVLADLVQGQTPATNDGVVRLGNFLKKLGCPVEENAVSGAEKTLAACLEKNEEFLLENILGGRTRKGERNPCAMLRFLLLQLMQAPAACFGGEENLRGKLFRLGFALGMDADTVESRLLQRMEQPGIDYKSAPELIRAYCLDSFGDTPWGYAMSQWMQRIYQARCRVWARQCGVRVPQAGRMTRYWRDRYRALFPAATGRGARELLGTMLREGVTPEDTLTAVQRLLADETAEPGPAELHLYSSMRYRAGSMLIDLTLELRQKELDRVRAGLQRQRLCLQQQRPLRQADIDSYRSAMHLADGESEEALRTRLAWWVQPVYPLPEGMEGNHKAQLLLQDLFRRVRRGGPLTRSELMRLTVAWYLCLCPPAQDRPRYMQTLEEELAAVLQECRLAPYRPNDWDADFAGALRRMDLRNIQTE